MANGSFSVSTSNQYIVGTVTWSETNTSTANNTSDVYVEMRLSRTNGYTTSGSGTFTITVNGVNVSNSPSFSITQNSNTLMVSGTVTGIAHNSDGTKQISISWSGNSNVFSVNSGSGTATLSTIPRASTLASTLSWTAGIDNLPVSLTVHDSSFRHHIAIQVQNPSGTWASVYDSGSSSSSRFGSSTTVSFSVDNTTTAYQQLGGWENRPAQMYIDTYDSSGNLIGETLATGTCYGATPATITFSNFNIGDSISAKLSNMYAGFTYTGTLTFGSLTKSLTFDVNTPNPTITFTSSEKTTMYNSIPNANSGTGNVYVSSKWNGVEINDGNPVNQNFGFTAYVTNSNPTFGNTYTYADTNSTTTAITNDNTKIVQNKSSVTVTLPSTAKATAINGATMSKYIANLNGVEITQNYSASDLTFVFGTISASTDVTLSIKAIDSRGNSTTTTKTVTILPYSNPVINSTVTRANGFDATTTLTMSGSISPLTISGTNKNTIQNLQYRYKSTQVSSGATWDTWSNFTYTTSGANYTATNVTLTLDNAQSWNVEVKTTDKFGSIISPLVVSQGVPFVAYDAIKKSMGLNGFPTHNNALEVFGDEYVSGTIYEGGTSLINKYAPAGTIQVYAGDTAPSGYLLCQGQAVSRTTYSRLFAAISTKYGSGDGSTTFNLPDGRGKTIVGLDSSQTEFNTLGKTGGEKTHKLTTTEMPSHTHQEVVHGQGGTGTGYGVANFYGSLGGSATSVDYTLSAGSDGAHNNLQPYITMNYIIRT